MTTYLGIDPASAREHAWAALSDRGNWLGAGLVAHDRSEVEKLADELRGVDALVVGIDAPRCMRPSRSPVTWREGRWRRLAPAAQGNGRHCEWVVNHLLTQVQWTRVVGDPSIPVWMKNGVDLYEWLGPLSAETYEVFPEATWKLAEKIGLDLEVNLPLTSICRVSKKSRLDVIDAVGSALTAREVHEGRGALVGGGDGLGCIALPRPLPNTVPELMTWPGVE